MDALIRFENISKVHRMGEAQVHALHRVSFTIGQNELVAIVGESGSGKSSILNIMGLLDRQTEGQYYLRGHDVSHRLDDELAMLRNREMGFVFQQYFLLPKLSAIQNVMLPLVYRGEKRQVARNKAISLLEKFSVGQYAAHKPHQLSGGQQQRVAIARALVGEPSMILADEPTGALDSKTSQEVMNLFVELHRQGLTIVIVSHDLHIADQCQRKMVMSDGEIAKA